MRQLQVFLRLRCLLRYSASVLVGAALWPYGALAQQRYFDLGPKKAVDAIPDFARQAGVQILAPAAKLQGLQTPAIRGQWDIRDALAKLIESTGLEIAAYTGGTIVLRQVVRPSASTAQGPELPKEPSRPVHTLGTTNLWPQIDVEEIVVTGSRIVRDGYESPTPLTVIRAEEIQAAATSNLADFVNHVPSLVGSMTPANTRKQSSSGQAGLNVLNLRALGPTRTLVLLDGQRSVPSTVSGLVDINNIPQELVSRVDVVAGGASAAYGSDALSGVVNFILDKAYTGVKGEISGGVTTYGDNPSGKISVTGGTPFAGGRGHYLFSGEVFYVGGLLYTRRPWNEDGWKIFFNPAYDGANGEPRLITRAQTGLSTASPGGIITNAALRGIEFGPGGAPRAYNYGVLVSDPFHVGGDWRSTNTDQYGSLEARIKHHSVFTRASYEVSATLNVFVQAQWGYSFAYNVNARQYDVANKTIFAGNPFIPASVQTQMTALGITQFTLGTMNVDLQRIGMRNGRTVNRYVIGAEGHREMFGSSWRWDAYYQKGISRNSENLDTTSRSRYNLAIDAVRHPVTGLAVCRIAMTDPTHPCRPYNIMGIGVNSLAALNYVQASAYRYQRFTEGVAAVTFNGKPFSSWAGPVSLALGAEHRHEAVNGVVSEADLFGDLFVGNFRPNVGSYTVTEGFIEAVLPLASHLPWARSMDLNSAVRATTYSASGYVTTWKAGLTYAPIEDLRVRVTRSRDIRAPNLGELFQTGSTTTNFLRDPFDNNNPTQSYQTVSGNMGLSPEKADTTGIGVVWQPRMFPGFNASLDYYELHIKDAIGTFSSQNILDLCFAGVQPYCAAFTRGTVNGVAVISAMKIQPFNFVTQKARGIDIEASYRIPASSLMQQWGGDITLRGLATRYIQNYQDTGVPMVAPTDTVGGHVAGGPPKWRYLASLIYTRDAFTIGATGRGVSAGVLNTSWIECTAGCPMSTINNMTTDNNSAARAHYWDLALSYRFGGGPGTFETFLNVRNIANKEPAIVPYGYAGTDFNNPPANATLYDVMGRVFRAGIRFRS
jgi:iron complex outermembrane receptor protein